MGQGVYELLAEGDLCSEASKQAKLTHNLTTQNAHNTSTLNGNCKNSEVVPRMNVSIM